MVLCQQSRLLNRLKMLQKESLGHFVRQVPGAARAPFKAFAAWNVRLEAYLRRPEVEQVRVSLPALPAC